MYQYNPDQYLWTWLCNSFTSSAETGCGGMHEKRHDSGDGSELEGLQAQQTPDTEGGAHDREAGETAEARAGEKAQAETSGDLHFRGDKPAHGFQSLLWIY